MATTAEGVQGEYIRGQKVLLLLPSSEHKLLAKWQGPVEVVRKTGPVTYEIGMTEQGISFM